MSDSRDERDETTDAQKVVGSRLAAAQPRAAFLTVVAGRSEVGRLYRLSNVMVVGRGSAVDLRLDDESISRKHAELRLLPDGGLDVLDLGSRNGTWFNGVRVDRVRLGDGDKFQVGSSLILKFSYQDEIETAVQATLYESATIDALTKLYNKKSLLDSLERELRYALRHMEPLTVLMVDVDRFKLVNDTYGHLAGDLVLQALARKVTESVRCEDVVARYGGEEVAVVLRGTAGKDAMIVAERIRRSVASCEVEYEDQRIQVTVSIGLASLEAGDNTTTKSLLARADQFLYRAKERGRNRVESVLTGAL